MRACVRVRVSLLCGEIVCVRACVRACVCACLSCVERLCVCAFVRLRVRASRLCGEAEAALAEVEDDDVAHLHVLHRLPPVPHRLGQLPRLPPRIKTQNGVMKNLTADAPRRFPAALAGARARPRE